MVHPASLSALSSCGRLRERTTWTALSAASPAVRLADGTTSLPSMARKYGRAAFGRLLGSNSIWAAGCRASVAGGRPGDGGTTTCGHHYSGAGAHACALARDDDGTGRAWRVWKKRRALALAGFALRVVRAFERVRYHVPAFFSHPPTYTIPNLPKAANIPRSLCLPGWQHGGANGCSHSGRISMHSRGSWRALRYYHAGCGSAMRRNVISFSAGCAHFARR